MIDFKNVGGMRDQGDTPLPRGEGAEAPQGDVQPGNIPLLYTEQNFNELVAANTAMQTEISAHEERFAEYRERLETQAAYVKDYGDSAAAAKKRADEAEAERDYLRDHAASLQRKLDRALGYLDRVIDEQDAYKEPAPLPGPLPSVGPDIESIPRAQPRNSSNSINALWPEASISSPTQRPRRY